MLLYKKLLLMTFGTTYVNGTHQLLVYADGVNILGGSIYTIKEKAEALVVSSKEIGL